MGIRLMACFANWTQKSNAIGAALLLATLLCGRWSAAGSTPTEYEATGSLFVRYPLQTVFGGDDRSYRFVVRVRGCEWSARLEPVAWEKLEEGEVVPDYIAAASDGTLFYKVTSVGTAARRARRGVTANTAIAVRGPGSTPYAIEDEIIALYYAFASHCYLANLTNSLVYPFRGALGFDHQLSDDIRNRALWELQPAPPGLPRYIVTTSTAGYTNAVLTTSVFTNVSGLRLPKQSSVRFLDANLQGSTNGSPLVWKELAVIVEAAGRSSTTISFVPELPTGASVQDITFWSNKPALNVSVRTKTNGWPDSAYLQRLYRARVVAAPVASSRTRMVRTAVLTLALGTLALFIVVLWWKRPNVKKGL